MTTLINNQPVYVERLVTPQVTDINTTPSIDPIVGSIAHDVSDPASLYIGDGTNWNKISSSGSTGGTIDGAVIKNSVLENTDVYGAVPGTSIGTKFSSAATVVRTLVIPDHSGQMVVDVAPQQINSKIISAGIVLSNTSIGNPSVLVNGHTFTSSASVPGRNLTIPDASGAMILDTAAQTMTDKTVSFPTVGGIPAYLSFYEILTTTHTWSGIWASPIVATVIYVKLGCKVLVNFDRAIDTATIAAQVNSDAIPTKYVPTIVGTHYLSYPGYGMTNGNGTTPYLSYNSVTGGWLVSESVGKAVSGAGWIGAGTSGLLDCSFEYYSTA